jgi:hypothetical protein
MKDQVVVAKKETNSFTDFVIGYLRKRPGPGSRLPLL